MARKEIIAGNWKMNKTHPEAVDLVSEIISGAGDGIKREIVLCPPFTALFPVAEKLSGTGIALGAQNLHWEPSGAYTGEVSAPMLSALGCRYGIVGHSERRAMFGETDESVRKKLHAVAEGGMVPILCVGETLEEREGGETQSVVSRQLKGALGGWSSKGGGDLVIAYEPVWAIGTGKTATPDQAEEVHRRIRGYLVDSFGKEIAENTTILYGGSMKPDNAAELLARGDIDGGLVGGASLKGDSFLAICRA